MRTGREAYGRWSIAEKTAINFDVSIRSVDSIANVAVAENSRVLLRLKWSTGSNWVIQMHIPIDEGGDLGALQGGDVLPMNEEEQRSSREKDG
jgi:hypothetical protein